MGGASGEPAVLCCLVTAQSRDSCLLARQLASRDGSTGVPLANNWCLVTGQLVSGVWANCPIVRNSPSPWPIFVTDCIDDDFDPLLLAWLEARIFKCSRKKEVV